MKKTLPTLFSGLLFAGLLTSCVPPPEKDSNASAPPAATENRVIETPSETPSPEEIVVVNGKAYTCAQILGLDTLECDRIFKSAFLRWGNKIDDYVNSGKLGPLGNGADAPVRYEDIAQLGLLACSVSAVGNTSSEYIPAAKTVVKTASGVELLPFWFEAQKSMCPEFPFKG